MKRLTTYLKIDIAHNILQTALQLYLDGGDRFSVLQLAGAAEEVISGHILQQREYDALVSEVSTAREAYLASISRLYKIVGRELTDGEMKNIGRGLNFARNGTKHHDINQCAALSLDIDVEAHIALGRAVENYTLFTGELTGLMRRFLALKPPESSFGTIGVPPA